MNSNSFHIDPSLWSRLTAEARQRGQNTSELLTEAIKSFLGPTESPNSPKEESQLAKLAGTWSTEAAVEFDKNVAVFGEIDYEIWK